MYIVHCVLYAKKDVLAVHSSSKKVVYLVGLLQSERKGRKTLGKNFFDVEYFLTVN